MFEQSANLAAVFYTVSAVLFILALRGLSSPESSRRGNMFGMIGIAIAIATTVWVAGLGGKALLLAGGGLAVGGVIGAFIAKKIPMTDMPQLVAAFHSLVGLAAVLVAVAAFFSPDSFGIMTADGIKPFSLLELLGLTFVIGFLLIIPIGGADMPVVVSMLNSYSGWAAAALGFTLGNLALIVTGALVGSSGAILSYIMCKAMNRSFISVILGGFGGDDAAAGGPAKEQRPVKRGSAEDAAFIMKNASKVIIVPGYGLAVAQAQHAVREMADKLKEEGVDVVYAIHHKAPSSVCRFWTSIKRRRYCS